MGSLIDNSLLNTFYTDGFYTPFLLHRPKRFSLNFEVTTTFVSPDKVYSYEIRLIADIVSEETTPPIGATELSMGHLETFAFFGETYDFFNYRHQLADLLFDHQTKHNFELCRFLDNRQQKREAFDLLQEVILDYKKWLSAVN